MQILEGVDLSGRNTLGVPARAQYWAEVESREHIPELVDWAKKKNLPVRVLGGGSNLVLAPLIHGLVLGMKLKGFECLAAESDAEVWRVQAGESWHEWVTASIAKDLSGLENLALIPGQVGAAPIQNIGAYGVELSDCLVAVNGYDTKEGVWLSFEKSDCEFAYRDSRFKRENNRYIIWSIDLRLSRNFNPILDYGPLQALKTHRNLTAADVMDTVIQVRQQKLPNPASVPNAGSFFKNPLVDESTYQQLSTRHPDLVAYPAETGWKLAAGWLIDQCGLKGQSSEAGVGCYEKQALVLINPKRAESSAIIDWQHHVQASVKQRFGVDLEREPRLWNGGID